MSYAPDCDDPDFYDDEDDDRVECTECDGSGKDASEWEGGERHPMASNGDCPVCCGFGRLDW